MVVKELERVSRGLRSLLFMVKAAILDDGVVRGVHTVEGVFILFVATF